MMRMNRRLRKVIRIVTAIQVVCQVFFPAFTYAAAPTIPGFYGNIALKPISSAQLPVLSTSAGAVTNAAIPAPANNTLTIHQTDQNAVIQWQSFDIGSNASVVFDQQGKTYWTLLNYINDSNPSQIYGNLTSDGQIYLINQNGILFGPGSKVNVHSLIATSLMPVDIGSGTLHFTGEDTDTTGVVSNQGTINTDALGSVFLVGSQVENYGTINAPEGYIVLAAGKDIALQENSLNGLLTINSYDTGQKSGLTTNSQTGTIEADGGFAGLYGRVVNQDGIVKNIVALKNNGTIELRATDEVETGPSSETTCPISTSPETGDSSFHPQGYITIDGFENTTNGSPLQYIWNQGVISSPHGTINLFATDRVLLDAGSTIDASGVWEDKPAGANLIQAQLNSVQLRDDNGQKDGILLGQNVSFNAQTGTSIGDTSGSIATIPVSAQDQSTKGGAINIQVTNGDIIAKQGSTVDFSGGGINYAAGAYDTTKLVSGNTVYDISSAPEWITYNMVLGNDQEVYTRFGITETFSGIYYGGSNSIKDYAPGFSQGDDAGTLTLVAPHIAFEGTMKGSAQAGIFQTSASDPLNASGDTKVLAGSQQEPDSGTLIMGNQAGLVPTNNDSSTVKALDTDRILGDVVISQDFGRIPTDFGIDTKLNPYPADRKGVSFISPDTLNNASLGEIDIYSNTSVTIDKGADLSLQPGGTLNITARTIEDDAVVTIPSGSITFNLEESKTCPQYEADGTTPNPDYRDMQQQITIDGTLDVSGLSIDNSQAGTTDIGLKPTGHTTGGTITLQDMTENGAGVLITSNARVDVSGGYAISQNGVITGGNAGTLDIQGSAIILDGDIRGYSLAGSNGGTIELHAPEIAVTDSPLDTLDKDKYTPGTVNLWEHRLDDTGFTQIALYSLHDLKIGLDDDPVTLMPSLVKMITPVPAGGNAGIDNYSAMEAASSEDLKQKGLFTIDPAYLGTSSITASAGNPLIIPIQSNVDAGIEDIAATIHLAQGSSLETAPAGAVTIQAPRVEIAGAVSAPAGKINVTASDPTTGHTTDNQQPTELGLEIYSTATISAAGYNKPSLTAPATGLETTMTPVDAGEVSLVAKNLVLNGNLNIDADKTNGSAAIIDVSGSQPTPYTLTNNDGTVSSINIASNPGTVTLSASGELDNNGILKANSYLDGLKGGTLIISKTNYVDPAIGNLSVTTDDIKGYVKSGFDDITLTSKFSLDLGRSQDDDGTDIAIARALTLDAPVIKGSQDIVLNAPMITLINSYYPSDNTGTGQGTTPAAPAGSLSLSGDWIDVNGSLNLEGFKDVNLTATHDISLTDKVYNTPAGNSTQPLVLDGSLQIPGDLTLTADRIYPTTQSTFSINALGYTDDKGNISYGTVTTKPGQGVTEGPILSAGGSLTIDALNIDHGGAIYAPMGSITLESDNRTYLDTGSIVSTKGQTNVLYGTLNATAASWTVPGKIFSNTLAPAATDPDKSITISGNNEVIVKQGATIDTSGGGSIFAYTFQPGIFGSTDPLQQSGQYIIVPGLSLPGNAVKLDGGGGLPAGTYTLVSPTDHEEYAFLPGAYVISDLGVITTPGSYTTSTEGYPLIQGYQTIQGTSVMSPLAHTYTIRPASDVLKQGGYGTVNQGGYQVMELAAGDAGSINISGPTAIINGTIAAQASGTGYKSGSLTLASEDNEVVNSPVALPEGFTYSTPVSSSSDYYGKCIISAEGLNGSGLGEITVGDMTKTKTVDLQNGAVLTAGIVTLNAADSITLESGSGIEATGTGGTASLNTPNGNITIDQGASVHATDTLNIQAGSLDLKGTCKVDSGTLNITSGRIFVTPENYQGDTTNGLYLTDTLTGFQGVSSLSLKGTQDVVFEGAVDLETGTELDIDAPRIVHEHGAAESGSANIVSKTISLKNTSTVDPNNPDPNDDASNTDTASLAVSADQMSIGHGDMIMNGFGSVDIQCTNDLTTMGKGSLTVDSTNNQAANAVMNITAGRITTSFYRNPPTDTTDQGPYEAPQFSIDAGTRPLTISGQKDYTLADNRALTPGGALEITARSIDDAGIIEAPSATVTLTATGSGAGDGIILEAGSEILARGIMQAAVNGVQSYTPGGTVALAAGAGGFTGQAGSLIDVSAYKDDQGVYHGDAGSVAISTPNGDAALGTTLTGWSGNGGRGGTFALDANSINGGNEVDLGALAKGLEGFSESISFRDRTGNLAINAGDTLSAHTVELTADAGTVTIAGTIEASGAQGDEGGSVEINAGQDLDLSGNIYAEAQGAGTGKAGGQVTLGSTGGVLRMESGSLIDVAGSQQVTDNNGNVTTAAGTGGQVYLSAGRTGIDASHPGGTGVNMQLTGTVEGASRVVAEAVKVYQDSNINAIDTSINGQYYKETNQFMANAATVKNTLLSSLDLSGSDQDSFQFVPGIEIQSQGDMILSSTWDLSTWRFGSDSEPGMLTLMAGGNLNINKNLVDHPTKYYYSLTPNTRMDSWGITLAAGADLTSADTMAVISSPDKGDLNIGQNIVYTEGAPLGFASGRDTIMQAGSTPPSYMVNTTMRYNLATFDGDIKGEVGGDLLLTGSNQNLNGGAIQSAAGAIDLTVKGDVVLGNTGAIRTTGYMENPTPSTYTNYWMYGNGGGINLDVGGDVVGGINPKAWDTGISAYEFDNKGNIILGANGKPLISPTWVASYVDKTIGNPLSSTRGIATMGGGDLSIRTGGDFFAQAGTFGLNGESDLKIVSGRDINGCFLVKDGVCELDAMGNIGTDQQESANAMAVEAFDTDVRLLAQGDIELGSVVNPNLANPYLTSPSGIDNVFSYTEDASVHITSLQGDVTITGLAGPYENGSSSIPTPSMEVLPPTLEVEAGRDIDVLNQLTLAPSHTGNLIMAAGRDISGSYTSGGVISEASIKMSDVDPQEVYGTAMPIGSTIETGLTPQGYTTTITISNRDSKAQVISDITSRDLIHEADHTPVTISAGNDIHDLWLYLPKDAQIEAGNDIRDTYIQGQNLHENDVSMVSAGNDIVMSTVGATGPDTGFVYGGPGTLIVQAGNSIDLGATQGIISDANDFLYYPPQLGNQGCNLIVASGIDPVSHPLDPLGVDQFFAQIEQAGIDYSTALKDDPQGALDIVTNTRKNIIEPFIGTVDTGSTAQQTGTESGSTLGKGDIQMISSQIMARGTNSNISILATGTMDVGRSDLQSDESTGIITWKGGNIDIFASKDVDVLQSRVMTLYGGDILMWSDQGNINAGRGSRTAIGNGGQQFVWDEDSGQITSENIPAATGSGIRTVTYSLNDQTPDPEPGNAYIFAPSGIIDAGEAGIAAENLYIGALQVRNTQNIQVAGISVGVPITNTNTGSLTALSGTSNLNQASQLTEEMSGLSSSSAKSSAAAEESYVPKWVKVMVIGFGDDEQGQDNSGQGDDDQAKKKAKKQNQDK